MENLFGQTLQEITVIVENMNLKGFVAKQICDWIYKKHCTDITQMSNIAISTRERLSKEYCINIIPYKLVATSKDGTKKYLFQFDKTTLIEAVTIFDKNRATLCISCQMGCKMNCAFCATGKMGFHRNLLCSEILNIYRSIDEFPNITNIVFMGMGEPLDNFDEVKKSIEILTSNYGYALSPRRITVSTAGFMPNMQRLITETNVDIAISLHNAISKERSGIMPIEKAYPIKDIVELLKQHDFSHQRHITFEYIVFHNINFTNRHIDAISYLLKGLSCRINLIRFHTIPNTPFVGATNDEILLFQKMLQAKGFNVLIRASKGEDILAACGLLSTKFS